jgi:hypothetical protein
MQKEGEKHHPIAARGLGDAFGAGEDDLVMFGKKSILLGVTSLTFPIFGNSKKIKMSACNCLT